MAFTVDTTNNMLQFPHSKLKHRTKTNTTAATVVSYTFGPLFVIKLAPCVLPIHNVFPASRKHDAVSVLLNAIIIYTKIIIVSRILELQNNGR